MKKMYIPSENELRLMQDNNANVYKYIVAKAIEAVIIEGINYSAKGILKHQFKYIKEDNEIVNSICQLYPNEVYYSQAAINNLELCKKIISQPPVDREVSLDKIGQFTETFLNDPSVINLAIQKLNKILNIYPQYRFEYREPNILLDNIFNCNITEKQAINAYMKYFLCLIEPAYVFKFSSNSDIFLPYGDNHQDVLTKSIDAYANRYRLTKDLGDDYLGKDILSNPSERIKRLLRTINQK